MTAAEVVRDRGGHVAAGVEFYLAAASAEVQAKGRVHWRLEDAAGRRRNSAAVRLWDLHWPGRGLVEKGETGD